MTKPNKSKKEKITIIQLDDLTGKDIVTNPGKSRGQIGGSDNRPWNAMIDAKQNAYNKIEGMTNVAKEKRSALAKAIVQPLMEGHRFLKKNNDGSFTVLTDVGAIADLTKKCMNGRKKKQNKKDKAAAQAAGTESVASLPDDKCIVANEQNMTNGKNVWKDARAPYAERMAELSGSYTPESNADRNTIAEVVVSSVTKGGYSFWASSSQNDTKTYRRLSKDEAMTKTISTFTNDRNNQKRPSRASEQKQKRGDSKRKAPILYTPQEDEQISDLVVEHQQQDAKNNTITPIPFHQFSLSLPGRDATSITNRWYDNLRHRLQEDGTLLPNTLHVTARDELRTDPKKAFEYYDSVPEARQIRGNDPRMSSTDAQDMGCIETDYKPGKEGSGYVNKAWKWNEGQGGSITGIRLHHAGCISKHGPKPAPKSKSAGDAYTASHVCQNDHCINREHICWETLVDNLSRKKCVGYCRFVKGDESVLVEINECNHDPRCMNFVTAEL